jgi:hypothetical protein
MKAAQYPMGELNTNDKGLEMISGRGHCANYHDTGKDQQEVSYQCPMNCEGNKTYNQPGVCPVCSMQLVMVGSDYPRICIE